MRLVDFDTFAREPFGHCTSGVGWLRFYPTPRLAGFVAWGSLSEVDVRQLVRCLEVELDVQPHVTLVDVRDVAFGQPAGFQQLQEYSQRQREFLGSKVTKLAIVRPEGLLGAAAAGFFDILEAPCPVEVFDARDKALAWLGVEASFTEELTAHLDRVRATTPFLRELRTLLDTRPSLASPNDIAKAMHLSARTLQRRLTEHDTTLTREITNARVMAAKRMLLRADVKLVEVALEVGCASPSHLSTMFRRATGMTPMAWRKEKLGQS